MFSDWETRWLRSSEKIKHLYLRQPCPGSGTVFLPHFYVEVRIDFNDIRSGFRDTVHLNRALRLNSDNSEALWAGDEMWEVDPKKLTAVKPESARVASLPEFVDADFIARMESSFLRYLLRSFSVKAYRNFILDIYSHPGESRDDFIRRCQELLSGPMRRELDSLHEVFMRRLQQIGQKYLPVDDDGPLDAAKTVSQFRNAYYSSSERIASFFLQSGCDENDNTMLFCDPPAENEELQERLSSLEWEAKRAIAEVKQSYEDKARSVDEYLIHPNLKDIHFVRTCILWMPAQAA